jgi:hypothetical protein
MLYSLAKIGLLALLALGAGGGCGPAAADERAPGNRPPLAAPAELRGARLLYQRPDGIYLRTLGQNQTLRLVADAAYPRWAPDGQSFAFRRGDRIMLFDLRDRSERLLAEAERARAVAFHPDGRQVLFTDGKSVKSFDLRGGVATTLATGPEFFELAVSPQGDFFAATVKAFGYRVQRFDLPSGRATEIARGCSAGVSPDGQRITVNFDGHARLSLRDSRTGEERGELAAPVGLRFDNQKWSNQPDWIAAVAEGKRQDVFVQRVRDSQAWRVTDEGDADRPDLFVE